MKDFSSRPCQAPMIEHIINNPRCAVWADMGTGKTAAVLVALSTLSTVEDDVFPALVLGPKRVASRVWKEETRKWTQLSSLRVSTVIGSVTERRQAMAVPADIYTTNYENLTWLVEHWGGNWPYRTVVADEASRLKSLRLSVQVSKTGKEFVRGQGGKRARSLGKIAHSRISRFIELTGTPAPNGLKDLWGQLWLLDAGRRLGTTHTAFMKRWFEKGFDGYAVEARDYAAAQIHAAVSDICLSVSAADYFDLGEVRVNDIIVQLPPASRRLYRDMEREMFARVQDRNVTAVNAAARTQKCLQMANGAVYVDPHSEGDTSPSSREWKTAHDEKLDALDSLVAELNGEPLLVSYKFRSDLARLQARFPMGKNLAMTANELAFKRGDIAVGFVHPASLGHGVDGFQVPCHNLAFFSHDWNLEEYQQLVGRIGPVRQMQAGLKRPVHLHRIIAEDTLDEVVIDRRTSKETVQEALLRAAARREEA